MKCPKCGAVMMSSVYGVREVGDQVRRTRKCTACGHRYVTMEKVMGPVKSEGRKKDV